MAGKDEGERRNTVQLAPPEMSQAGAGEIVGFESLIKKALCHPQGAFSRLREIGLFWG